MCSCDSNESLGAVKHGEFLDQLSDCQLLMKDSAVWIYNCIMSVTGIFHWMMGVRARLECWKCFSSLP